MKNRIIILAFLQLLAGVFTTLKAQQSFPASPDINNDYEFEARQNSLIKLRAYPGNTISDPAAAMKAASSFKSMANKSAAAVSWSRRGPAYGIDTIISQAGGDSTIGRTNCVRFDPVNPNIMWAGSASGGLWKSVDGGKNWTVNSALEQFQSIGVTDIAINPKNTQVMYIVTGDGDYDSAYSLGVLKSTDGGNSWIQMTTATWSLSPTLSVTRILIHPTNPDTVLFCSSNWILRTTNGGNTWGSPTVPNGGGFKDMEFHPANPNIIYASSKSFVFKSTDAGVSWIQLGGGLPTGTYGRVAIAVTAASPNTIYALYSNAPYNGPDIHGLFKSIDAGSNWTMVSNSGALNLGLMSRYTTALAVSPTNSNEVWVAGSYSGRSLNGGVTWATMNTRYYDNHEIEYSPFNSNVIFVVNDGGVYKSTNGSTFVFSSYGMETTQFYKIGLSAQSNIMFSGAQDMGHFNYLSNGKWRHDFMGDGMESMIDYSNENYHYKATQLGNFYRSVNKGVSYQNIKPVTAGSGDWVTPYQMDQTDPKIIYAGYEALWKTTDRGTTWAQASPDLSSPKSRINTVAVSASNPSVIVAATIDSIYRTIDGGSNWACINASLPTSSVAISDVVIHPVNPLVMWLTLSGFSAGLKIFKTIDGGSTWTNVSGSLPNIPVNCIVYEKNSPDALYIGTDIGVFYTDNTLTNWSYMNIGLPNVIVAELEINYQTQEIFAATHGRGVWSSKLNSNSTSVEKSWKGSDVKLYPNPASERIFLETNGMKVDAVEILDLNGRIVLNDIPGTNPSVEIDLKGLVSGVYIMKINSGQNKLFRKFVVEAR